MSTALHKLIDEDPSLHVRRDDATHETILSAVGESGIDVAVHRLKEKFGVQVEMRTPRVPYRESIRAKAQAQGRYKRQTGGHGQFGDAWLEVEPLQPGSGVVFETRIVGGSVPRNFWPAVEKGIREQAIKGVIAGYPLSDFKATLYDGSFHQVDSSEMSFKIAGSLALQSMREGRAAYPLEPIMTSRSSCPRSRWATCSRTSTAARSCARHGRRGRGHQSIKAHVPLAEIFRYSTDLRSMTGGRGTFTSTLLGYEQCPSHIAEKVIAAHEEKVEEGAAAR
jgi:elongation factor G